MKTTFICLANSYKEGGRCVAGIEIENEQIVFKNNMPKWIRPVSEMINGEIPTRLVRNIKLLDIIKIETIKPVPKKFQTENVLYDDTSMKVVGSFNRNNLAAICNATQQYIFTNNGKAVSEEQAEWLDHSLSLIYVNDFEVFTKTFTDEEKKPQIRIKFKYNLNQYDLPVTDPVFLDKYKLNNNITSEVKELYLVISLGRMFEGWYYKLIAAVIIKSMKPKTQSNS